MRIEDATIRIEPRTAGEILDLALAFARANVKEILILFPGFAAAAWAVALSLAEGSRSPTGIAGASCLALTPFADVLLVAGAGRQVFGGAFSPAQSFRAFRSLRWGGLFRLGWRRWLLAPWIAFFFAACDLPEADLRPAFYLYLLLPLVLFPFSSFKAEFLLLEGLRGSRYMERAFSFARGVGYLRRGRSRVFRSFAAVLTLAVFAALERGAALLFRAGLLPAPEAEPPAGEYLADFFGYLPALYDALIRRPEVTVFAVLAFWFVYPVARFAWFFTYLDLRIRREAWDLDLDLRLEAARLLEEAK